jgi:hypothetical protein
MDNRLKRIIQNRVFNSNAPPSQGDSHFRESCHHSTNRKTHQSKKVTSELTSRKVKKKCTKKFQKLLEDSRSHQYRQWKSSVVISIALRADTTRAITHYHFRKIPSFYCGKKKWVNKRVSQIYLTTIISLHQLMFQKTISSLLLFF